LILFFKQIKFLFMHFNWTAVAISTIIPMLIGFIYYNPKTMGGPWMKVNSFTEEGLKEGGQNMAVIFGLSIFCSFLLTMGLHSLVIHQWGFFSSLFTPENGDIFNASSPANAMVTEYVSKYGENFRSYKHGALHGILATIMIALPLIAVNAMFERRGAKYIFIHLGYWALCLAGMGAVICGMK
jgi:hypothetical protein